MTAKYKSNPQYVALSAELEKHGVTDYRVVYGGKHYRLLFSWRGKELFYVFPASPSDRRGAENAVSDLRRIMGVKRIVKKNPAKRKVYRKRKKHTLPKVCAGGADTRLSMAEQLSAETDKKILSVIATTPIVPPKAFWQRVKDAVGRLFA